MAITRIGFLGCGGIARQHLSRLAKIEGVQPVAFCDTIIERAQELSKNYGAKAYDNFNKMIDEVEMEALFVGLPPYAHKEQEILAARRGIHMFIEKPIGLDLENCKRVNEAIEASGVICSVLYLGRYSEAVNRAKQLLENRTIGLALGAYYCGMGVQVPAGHWWLIKEKSGGQMVEQATHVFDLMRYLLGDVKRVYASYAVRAIKDLPARDISDVGIAILEFDSGVIGSVSTSAMVEVGWEVSLKIYCQDLILDVLWGKLIITRRGELQAQVCEQFMPVEDPMLIEDQVFIDAVRTGDASKIKSTYSDAMRTLAVTLACNKSAETGEPVDVVI